MYGFHPANLAFRFLLEVAALLALGAGAYAAAPNGLSWPAAVLCPVVAAAMWGTFRVPDDGSSSGTAPVAVPGPVRLALELLVFGTAVGVCFAASASWAIALGSATVVHYALSIDRIRWLLTTGAGEEARPDVA